ncbi:MAG: hypothetical protein EXQ96_02540 [Alphaproteobacteria bacterium]|nr:hypothetical protein [Alphaproteobacteria bacterium]
MVRLLQERRFPLYLLPSVDSIWELYNQAKRAKWDPSRSIPWDEYQPERYSQAERDAARLSWSRRVWAIYGRLAENPALLVRFCMEYQREADPKYFLSVKGTEEAWHVDCCQRFAALLGGFVAGPVNQDYGSQFNRGLHVQALDADVPLDAYVAAWATVADAIQLGLHHAAAADTRDPAAAAILARMVADKARHVAFGWLYLDQRAPGWDGAARDQISHMAGDTARRLLTEGTEVPALAPAGIADHIAAADRLTHEAGLGAAGEEAALVAVRATLDTTRERFAGLGLTLANVVHPRHGAL